MLKDRIGNNAGIIWNMIDEHREIPLSDLALLSNLSETDVNMALGWLYRENKVAVYEKEGKQIVFLVY